MICDRCGREMKYLPPPTGRGPLGSYVCEGCGLKVDRKSHNKAIRKRHK